jgi:copper transport protein
VIGTARSEGPRSHGPRWGWLRRPWRLTAAVAIVAGVVGGLSAPASAHATLESTTPSSGAVLAKSPGRIVLHFDEQVEVSFGSIRVFNSNSKRVDAGNATHVPGNSHSVQIDVPAALPGGGYVVTWRVISADSHPVHGAFTFTVGAGGSAAGLTGEASQLLASSAGSKSVGVAFGVIRFLGFAAVAVLIGGAVFAVAVWPGARDDRRARRILWGAFAALIVLTGAAFAIQGPYGGGLPLGDAIKPSVLSAVFHTKFGRVYVGRIVLLVAAVPVLAAMLRRPSAQRVPPWALTLGAVLGILVLGTWGSAGHAGTGSLVAVALPFDAVHLGGASIWIGGLVMVLAVVLPESRGDNGGAGSPLRSALPRFSQWALGAVVAIAITGGFAAWQQARTWGAVTATPYGKLLIYKTAGFVALILLAAVSRSTVHGDLAVPGVRRKATARPGALTGPAPSVARSVGAAAVNPDTAATSRLTRAVSAELVIAGTVLALTAWLVNAQPAKSAYAAPYSAQVTAGPDFVNAVIDPAKAGPLTVHMYILSASGSLLDVPEVAATMSDSTAGVSGLKVPLLNAGPGHFVAYGFEVPIRGTWVLNVTVRVDDIDEYNAQPIVVHIR